MRFSILLIAFASILAAQTEVNGSRNVAGDLAVQGNLSAGGETATVEIVASLPGTCTANRVAIRTSDNSLHRCTGDAWAQIGSAGGSPIISEQVYLMTAHRPTGGSAYDLAPPFSFEGLAAAEFITGRSADPQMGGARFNEGSDNDVSFIHRLPDTWTGVANTTIDVHWYGVDNNSLNTHWQLEAYCIPPDSATEGLNIVSGWTVEGAVTDTHIRYAWNTFTFSGLTLSSCSAGELLFLQITRFSSHANDTYTGTAWITDVILKYERTAE